MREDAKSNLPNTTIGFKEFGVENTNVYFSTMWLCA